MYVFWNMPAKSYDRIEEARQEGDMSASDRVCVWVVVRNQWVMPGEWELI